MPFYPPREAGDDPNFADALSETSYSNYGVWMSGTSAIPTIVLDNTKTMARISSVRAESPYGAIDYYGLFFFSFITPINMQNWETLRFYMAAQNKAGNNPNLTGFGRVHLVDINENIVVAEIGFVADGTWYPKTIGLQSFVGSPFDWTQVKRWQFMFDHQNVSLPWYGYDIWLDAGPFIYKSPAQYVTWFRAFEDSTEKNKTITVTNNTDGSQTTQITPFNLTLIQNNSDTYTIQADPTRFLQWENGSTNPTRIYTPAQNTTLQAIYTPLIRYNVTINSSPSGKNVKIDGTSGNTPVSWSVSPATYTITLLDTNGFDHWEDSSTNPIRTITVSSDLRLTATYIGGGDGGIIVDWGSIIVGVTILGVGGVALAYFLRRKRRK